MKLTLDRTYIYNGVFYGPGEVEVADADAASAIKDKLDAAKQREDLAPAAPHGTKARK